VTGNRIIPRRLSVPPVFSIAAAGALRGYAFRSLDAGAEMHGGIFGIWGRGWGLHFRGDSEGGLLFWFFLLGLRGMLQGRCFRNM